jgi:hypothetical protein
VPLEFEYVALSSGQLKVATQLLNENGRHHYDMVLGALMV